MGGVFAACAGGGLILAMLFFSLLMPIILGFLLSILSDLSRLLPRHVRETSGAIATRPLRPLTALALIGGFIGVLIAFFAYRFHDLNGVLIPFIMVAIIAGFFSLFNWVDLKFQTRKARKSMEAKHIPDGIHRPGNG